MYILSFQNSSFQALLPIVRKHIIDGFTPKALDLFRREFEFFDKVTSISGVLFPLPKEERRAGIRRYILFLNGYACVISDFFLAVKIGVHACYYYRELEKIQMEGEDLYLPTAPNKLVRGIRVDSGIPLQSAAKVPIMITFNVVDRDGDQNDIKPQACIFKVNLCLSWAKKLRFELPTKIIYFTNNFGKTRNPLKLFIHSYLWDCSHTNSGAFLWSLFLPHKKRDTP